MDVVVIGGSGLVGTNVVEAFHEQDHAVVGTYRTNETPTAAVQLDKTDAGATYDLIVENDPDVVIDTAAFHAVDDCKDERQRAWRVNAGGTQNAAVGADTVGAHFVYISTDYVVPGRPEEAPYTEADGVRPTNYYGETKYAGEQAAKIADSHTILRPSVVYGLASANFSTWVLGELEDTNEVRIVDDQVSTPTYAPDLGRACVRMASSPLTGLYHAAGPDRLSRYEFTVQLAETFGFDTDLVTPITTEELGQDAPRPADSSLSSERLYDALGQPFCPPEVGFDRMATAWS